MITSKVPAIQRVIRFATNFSPFQTYFLYVFFILCTCFCYSYFIMGPDQKNNSENNVSVKFFRPLPPKIIIVTSSQKGLKLHKTDASPPSRAVMMLCEIIGLDVDFIEAATLEPLTPSFMEISTLRQLPVLVDGDLVLEDSNAILQYLADVYGKRDSLYPKDLKKRALVNQKLFFESSMLYPRHEDCVFPAVLEGVIRINKKKVKDIEEAFGYLEDFLTKTPYLAGEHMTIADIAAIASVTSLDKIVPLNKKLYPKSAKWLKNMTSEKFCANQNAQGAMLFGHMIKFTDSYYNKSKITQLFYKFIKQKISHKAPQNSKQYSHPVFV